MLVRVCIYYFYNILEEAVDVEKEKKRNIFE